MKTLVVGTGVFGTIYGWALAEAGHDVTHLVRPGRMAALAGGIPLDLLDERKGYPPKGTHTYRAKLAEQIAATDGYEAAFVSAVGLWKYNDIPGLNLSLVPLERTRE